LTLKTEGKCSFEMSVEFQRTTWRYILEYRTLLYLFIYLNSKWN
jgi:hypothetical protein